MNRRDFIVCGASAVTASTLAVLVYRYLSQRQRNVYETSQKIREYMLFHYGKPNEILSHGFQVGPKDGLDFPLRCAQRCIDYAEKTVPSRALEVGCAVGRSTFEMARHFQHVMGIDFSEAFINICTNLKTCGKVHYQMKTEGFLYSEHDAIVDEEIDRSRVSFQCGDACNLPSDLGQFGCVLAANVICRLPNPYKFLDRLPSLVAPGGIAVLTCPFTWLEEFTPKSLWLGGYKDSEGNPVSGSDKLRTCLQPNFELLDTQDIPYIIKETAREHEWGISQLSVWKRHKDI